MKELVDGVEYFRGEAVGVYEGRFTGSFDLGDDGVALNNDDLVCYLVTARVGDPKFSHTKTGELKCTNSHKIEDAKLLSYDEAMYLLDAKDHKVNGVNDGLIEVRPSLEINLSSADSGTCVGFPPDIPTTFDQLYQKFVEVS